jgi:hypothetical protein
MQILHQQWNSSESKFLKGAGQRNISRMWMDSASVLLKRCGGKFSKLKLKYPSVSHGALMFNKTDNKPRNFS